MTPSPAAKKNYTSPSLMVLIIASALTTKPLHAKPCPSNHEITSTCHRCRVTQTTYLATPPWLKGTLFTVCIIRFENNRIDDEVKEK